MHAILFIGTILVIITINVEGHENYASEKLILIYTYIFIVYFSTCIYYVSFFLEKNSYMKAKRKQEQCVRPDNVQEDPSLSVNIINPFPRRDHDHSMSLSASHNNSRDNQSRELLMRYSSQSDIRLNQEFNEEEKHDNLYIEEELKSNHMPIEEFKADHLHTQEESKLDNSLV